MLAITSKWYGSCDMFMFAWNCPCALRLDFLYDVTIQHFLTDDPKQPTHVVHVSEYNGIFPCLNKIQVMAA